MGYIYAGILVVFLALVSATLWYRAEAISAVADKEKVEKELSIAVEVNERNAETMRRYQETAAAERKATEKELEAARLRAASVEEIRKDMEHVQGANDPAGSYWDAFGERLRQSQRSH